MKINRLAETLAGFFHSLTWHGYNSRYNKVKFPQRTIAYEIIRKKTSKLNLDLLQNTGQIFKQHFAVAHHNSQKGKDSPAPNAFSGDYTAAAVSC